MSNYKIQVKIACGKKAVGEGAIWDYKYNRLLWIDCPGKLFIFTPNNGKNREIKLEKPIGSVVPYQQNSVIVVLKDGIYELNLETEKLSLFCLPEKEPKDNIYFNDGKCDSKGRLWVGTMDKNFVKGMGALYSVSGNGESKKVLNDVTLSNGICWSPDEKKMYYQDSPLRTVSCFDYDINNGEISNRREVINLPEGMGNPDGNTIDEDGMVWIAHFGGACVSQWNPHTGKMLKKIEVPAYNVTSLAFGGENLDDLYITTASILPPGKEKIYPDAGKLFVCKPGVKGIKANYFSK